MDYVSQSKAKLGVYIDSYETKELFDAAKPRLEKVFQKKKTKGKKLVYTMIPFKSGIMWQVFMIDN